MSNSTSSAATSLVLLRALKNERIFLLGITVGFIAVGVATQNLQWAMWYGFMLAGYSAIANDSIQTIGTFLASNQDRPWWALWIFIAGIFIVTMSYGWVIYDGDVSHQRLTAKGFSQAPTELTYLQIAAPLFLLVLTRLRMPVSTTFLILSCFSTSSSGISSVLVKSLSGYVVAFVSAMIIWLVFAHYFKKWFVGKAAGFWLPLQWITSGTLWAVWLMQDAANIAVYLPRTLTLNELIFFLAYITIGLGVLFYLKGDRIQDVVLEKSEVTDVRMATIIDLIYAIVLYYFKSVSVIPMSTTWVFLGLLGGRELAMAIRKSGNKSTIGALRMMGKDALFAGMGLAISIFLAIAINPNIEAEFVHFFGF